MSTIFKDMLGREVILDKTPNRIISLVPSQTELLYELGVGNRVVGQTVFCIHPKEGFETTVRVGGTKKIKYDVIDDLNPDLIICNKEENTKEIVDTLSQKYPVWVSDIFNLIDNSTMILKLGNIVNSLPKAVEIVETIENKFNNLKIQDVRTCLYFIWREPFMAAAGHTFINEVLSHAGFNNVLKHKKRYPQLTKEEIIQLNPEVVLLSSEPYPFREKHMEELQQFLPNAKIQLVDGEMFSWYGSRLMHAPDYFKSLHQ